MSPRRYSLCLGGRISPTPPLWLKLNIIMANPANPAPRKTRPFKLRGVACFAKWQLSDAHQMWPGCLQRSGAGNVAGHYSERNVGRIRESAAEIYSFEMELGKVLLILLTVVFVVVAIICHLVAFSTDYWLKSSNSGQRDFLNIGLWTACFNGYLHPHEVPQRQYDGCNYISSDYYRTIRDWLKPCKFQLCFTSINIDYGWKTIFYY